MTKLALSADTDKVGKAAAVVMNLIGWNGPRAACGFDWHPIYRALCDMAGDSLVFRRECDLVEADPVAHPTRHEGVRRDTWAKQQYTAAAYAILTGFTWDDHPFRANVWGRAYDLLKGYAAGLDANEIEVRDLIDIVEPARKVAPKRRRMGDRADRLIAKLESMGYRRLGAGAYSTVMVHDADPDYVIKISKRKDDWPAYVKWGQDMGFAGTFTPKVVAMKVFKDGRYIAKMQRLSATLYQYEGDDRDDLHHDVEAAAGVAYRAAAKSSGRRDPADRPKLQRAIEQMTMTYLDETYRGLGTFMAKFGEAFDNGCYDLHNGNWMVDDNNNVYLTDPLTDDGYTGNAADVRIRATSPVFVRDAA